MNFILKILVSIPIILIICFGVLIFFIGKIFYVNTVFELDLPKEREVKAIRLTIPKDEESILLEEKSQIKELLKQLDKSTSKTFDRGLHIDYLYPDKKRAAVIIEFILEKYDRFIEPILIYIPEYPANLFVINQGGTGGRHMPMFDNAIELFNWIYDAFNKEIPDWYDILLNE